MELMLRRDLVNGPYAPLSASATADASPELVQTDTNRIYLDIICMRSNDGRKEAIYVTTLCVSPVTPTPTDLPSGCDPAMFYQRQTAAVSGRKG